MSDPSSPPTRRALALAYLKVLLAGALWGTSGPFSVTFHRMGIPPESVAFLRPATGTLIILLIVLLYWRSLPRLGTRHLWGMLGLGGVLVAGFQYSYQMSTAAVGVPATVALIYLAPAYVMGASYLLFRERLSWAKGALLVVAVGGVWLTVLGARGVDVALSPAGVLWGCICAFFFGSYTLFGKHYGVFPGPLLPLFWSTLGGTALISILHLFSGDPLVLPGSFGAWALLAAFAFITMALAAFLLFSAMATIEAGRAAIGTTMEPLVASLLAMLLLGQTLTPWGWMGLLLLVMGVAGAYLLRAPGSTEGTPVAGIPPVTEVPPVTGSSAG